MSGGSPAPLPSLRVLADPDAVADAAAAEIARLLGAAVAERGVAHWATTGGSAAPPVYRRLRARPLRDALDWSRVHVWWGDDRFVPPDHPLSNVLPLTQILLDAGDGGGDEGGDGADVHVDHLHPVPVTGAIAAGGGAPLAAARYAEALRTLGPAAGAGGFPEFDLVVVGVGPDGHLLSVFPGSPTWDAAETCLAVPAPTHVEPHVARVTMHPAVLASARHLLVVATGESKAGVLGRAWTGDDVRELPVRAARLATATWFLDEAAAAGLPRG